MKIATLIRVKRCYQIREYLVSGSIVTAGEVIVDELSFTDKIFIGLVMTDLVAEGYVPFVSRPTIDKIRRLNLC